MRISVASQANQIIDGYTVSIQSSFDKCDHHSWRIFHLHDMIVVIVLKIQFSQQKKFDYFLISIGTLSILIQNQLVFHSFFLSFISFSFPFSFPLFYYFCYQKTVKIIRHFSLLRIVYMRFWHSDHIDLRSIFILSYFKLSKCQRYETLDYVMCTHL